MPDTTDHAFITLGFFRAGAGNRLTDDECNHYEGEVGAVGQCADMAQFTHTCEQLAIARGFEHMDVYAYEVAEPIGQELRNCKGDYGHMRLFIARTVAEYFVGNTTTFEFTNLRNEMRAALGL